MAMNDLLMAISGGLFVTVCAVVGIRLLLLARRTHQLPEFTVGFGLVSICLVGAPIVFAGGVGRLDVNEVSLPMTVLGLAIIGLGFTSFYVFNWKVFRPASGWAKALVGAAALGLAVSTLGSCMAIVQSPDGTPSGVATQMPILLLWIVAVGNYLWTSIEALREYSMSRRRLALGLADPVVVNRFLLWGLANLVQVFTNGTNLILHTQGITPSIHLLPTALVSAGAVWCGISMILAFVPPPAYLRYLRKGA